MISPQLVEVCQGLLTREEVNPERVAQDRRPRESGQLHSFVFWLPRSGLYTVSTAFLGRKCSGWGAIKSYH